MYTALLATLFIVGNAHGSTLANHYFDSVLTTVLRNEIRVLELDPAPLPDFTTKFEDIVTIIGKVKGKAEYFEGSLSGLSHVRRFSECQGPYYGYGSKSINCTIVFDKLSISYDGKLKYGKVPRLNIKASSKITNSLVFVEISQNPPMQPFVKNFLYQQTGHQKIKHSGLGLLNKYMKLLDDEFMSHVQAQLFNSMSQKFHFALNRAVSVVPLPN